MFTATLQTQLILLGEFSASSYVPLIELQDTLADCARQCRAAGLSEQPVADLQNLLRIAPLTPRNGPVAAEAALAYLRSQLSQPVDLRSPRDPLEDRVLSYKIHRKLGQGCFSEVFLATELEMKRPVALKIHRPPFRRVKEGDVPLRGLFNELRFQAVLDDATIVRVLRCGLTMGSKPYLALEHMPGGTLADRLSVLKDATDPSPDAALVIAERMLLAAAAVHASGILHGDMTITNFLIGGQGEIKLADFALARRIGEPPYLFERTGSGKRRPEGFLDDVFQLGKVLFQIFTRHPSSISDVKVLSEPSPSLRRPDLSIPPWIDGLVARSLQQNHAERFPHARAMLAYFGSHL